MGKVRGERVAQLGTYNDTPKPHIYKTPPFLR